MFQQIIALIIIFFFLAKIIWQKKQNKITFSEFIFWLSFWILAGIAILSLKWIDKIVHALGFSASGIDILLYLSIVVLFYIIFKLRLKIERLDRDITKITRAVALNNNLNNNK